ncbi:MAG: DUF3656 domain-containing protein [Tissierellia bacterium]|nr:DUF3656 domain-containing protein [Tissierellia bacterium]MDD4726840.1 DUF3656 domain-containing protein [Tissierellia bacterium]
MNNKVELLAPVGSKDALIAAVQNGANAVYLGGKSFNARHNASNFDKDQLIEAIVYAHLRNVKVYVTVNILIDDSEMNEVIEYVKFLYDIDIDAVLVQDLGLASVIRELLPDLDMHASTQMTINNLEGTKLLKKLGFSRIVLARETPLEEIKKIHDNIDIELETFVHGALCMSYSGQCLMSSMIGGRSGNRGRCAQPCRMKYSLVDKNDKLVDGFDQVYLLSPKDLNTIRNLDKLFENGIVSLKIEGRMKRPEYVATIVRNYRNVIDNSVNILTDNDMKDIKQIFNRGFTKGLPFGDFGKDFMSSERPDNRGIYLGKVVRADKYKVYIELEEDIEQGDGIEFLLKSGQYKGIKSPIEGDMGSIIHIDKPGYIENGSSVYKTSSQSLLNRAIESYMNESIKYPIEISIDLNIGSNPVLRVKYKDKKIEVISDKIVEKSQKVSITKDKVVEQLSKLGDTVYCINKIDINLDDEAFLPISVLNQLRRDAIDKLNAQLKVFNNRKAINNDEFNKVKSDYFYFRKSIDKNKNRLTIKVSNHEQFNSLDLVSLDRVYLAFYDNLQDTVNKLKKYKKEAYLWTDNILYSKDLSNIENILKNTKNLDGVSVSNLGSLKFIKDNFNIDIHADIGLNVFNSNTVNYLKNNSVQSITLSPELNLSQIKNISSNVGGSLEGIVYGYLPVMTTKNCPLAIVKGCKNDNNCNNCNFAKGYGLKDRMDAIFRLERKEGHSAIFNSVPLMLLDSLDTIANAGIDMFRLDFTNETKNIAVLQKMFYDYLNKEIDLNSIKEFLYEFKEETPITNGHYFRGILS